MHSFQENRMFHTFESSFRSVLEHLSQKATAGPNFVVLICIHDHENNLVASNRFLEVRGKRMRLAEDATDDLNRRLQTELLRSSEGLEEALGEVARAAQRLWTSDEVCLTIK